MNHTTKELYNVVLAFLAIASLAHILKHATGTGIKPIAAATSTQTPMNTNLTQYLS